MCWLAFTDTRATSNYFSAWGRLWYKQPHFVNFWTPISEINRVGIEIWYAGGTASKTMVATADQLTTANC